MSKSRVPTRKIKHDEFVSTVSRLVLYLEMHAARVGWVLLAVAVLAAVGFGVGLHLRGRAREASFALGNALAEYHDAALAPGGAGPEEALAAFRGVVERFPNWRGARIASFYEGLCLIDLGRLEEAEETLAAYLDRYPAAFHAPQARLALARLAEERGDRDRALELYRAAAEVDALSLPQPEALMELARFLELNGDRDEAVLVYDRVQSEFPDSEYGPQALQRARILGGEPLPQ